MVNPLLSCLASALHIRGREALALFQLSSVGPDTLTLPWLPAYEEAASAPPPFSPIPPRLAKMYTQNSARSHNRDHTVVLSPGVMPAACLPMAAGCCRQAAALGLGLARCWGL